MSGVSSICAGVGRADIDVENDVTQSSYFWGISSYSGSVLHCGDRHSYLGGRPFSPGQTLGLLLDCATGSLIVYLDGERLGVAVDSGLGGIELCGLWHCHQCIKRSEFNHHTSQRSAECTSAAQAATSMTLSGRGAVNSNQHRRQRTQTIGAALDLPEYPGSHAG